jgi:hypothetical protein
LGHGTKNPGKVELDPARVNDPASYHRMDSNNNRAIPHFMPDSFLDAQRSEPYHQPNLPDGCGNDGV